MASVMRKTRSKARSQSAPQAPRAAAVAAAAEPKRRMSGPGLAARQALLDAAHRLLRKKRKSRITLAEVARSAKVSRGSAYFFYKDIHALYASLLRLLHQQLHDSLKAPIRREVETWQDVFRSLVERIEAYGRKDVAICQLTIGIDMTPSQKLADRAADVLLGDIIASQIERFFELPTLANRSRTFFHCVEIVDLMLTLSMLEHNEITSEYVEEGIRTATAYLELYLPRRLPRRKPSV
jgi:AcrR family transcriptional regulator